MYPLLPWKWLFFAFGLAMAVAIYADDVGRLVGWEITDRILVRSLPAILMGIPVGFFGPTGYLAPWRVTWRLIPKLNSWFPDLNGIWLGTTGSNWPTIKKMLEAAQAQDAIEQIELHSTAEQRDAMAVQITASLFTLKIAAGLSSTDGQSYSIAAKPRRDQHSGHLHLSYVYEQTTPDHAITDEERHMGAADLVIDPDDLETAEGVLDSKELENWAEHSRSVEPSPGLSSQRKRQVTPQICCRREATLRRRLAKASRAFRYRAGAGLHRGRCQLSRCCKVKLWCGRWDSNPHGHKAQQILSLVCLPFHHARIWRCSSIFSFGPISGFKTVS